MRRRLRRAALEPLFHALCLLGLACLLWQAWLQVKPQDNPK